MGSKCFLVDELRSKLKLYDDLKKLAGPGVGDARRLVSSAAYNTEALSVKRRRAHRPKEE